MKKINFYVPEENCEDVKIAMFKAGAGIIGKYNYCAWQIKGQGQCCPQEESNPYIGKPGEFEQFEEYKVELVCEDDKLDNVIAALKKAHPYEEPAYQIIDFTV